MNLREISAALQRGEALTATQKFFVRDSLLGRPIREPKSYDEEAWAYVAHNEGDRFTSVDAALAFVAEAMPERRAALIQQDTWGCFLVEKPPQTLTGQVRSMLAKPPAKMVTAPTPSAAIMAAAIEAHLAKGGE